MSADDSKILAFHFLPVEILRHIDSYFDIKDRSILLDTFTEEDADLFSLFLTLHKEHIGRLTLQQMRKDQAEKAGQRLSFFMGFNQSESITDVYNVVRDEYLHAEVIYHKDMFSETEVLSSFRDVIKGCESKRAVRMLVTLLSKLEMHRRRFCKHTKCPERADTFIQLLTERLSEFAVNLRKGSE